MERVSGLTGQSNKDATTVDTECQTTVDEKRGSSEGKGIAVLHPMLCTFDEKDDAGDQEKEFGWRVYEDEVGEQGIIFIKLQILVHPKYQTFEESRVRVKGCCRLRQIHDEVCFGCSQTPAWHKTYT